MFAKQSLGGEVVAGNTAKASILWIEILSTQWGKGVQRRDRLQTTEKGPLRLHSVFLEATVSQSRVSLEEMKNSSR